MLKIRFKNNKYNAVWLVEPRVTIGRSGHNDLAINDPGVAEDHLEILVNHEQLTLKNLVGSQPVRVNNHPVSDSCNLKAEDVIQIGSVELQVIDPKKEVPPGPVLPLKASRVRPSAATGWALKALHPALASRVYPVKEATLLGRSSECDISLAAAHLSRRHAQLEIIEGCMYVQDLDSANGTYLNGKAVKEARVKRGDELRFDTLAFGVIGPPDEFAKTTIRKTAGRTLPAPPAASPTSHAVVTNSPAGNHENILQPRHKGRYSMALLVILTLVIVWSLYMRA